MAGEVQQRGAFVGMGNTAEEAAALVRGWLRRGVESDGAFKRISGAGFVAPKDGAYKRAHQACGPTGGERHASTRIGVGAK